MKAQDKSNFGSQNAGESFKTESGRGVGWGKEDMQKCCGVYFFILLFFFPFIFFLLCFFLFLIFFYVKFNKREELLNIFTLFFLNCSLTVWSHSHSRKVVKKEKYEH